MNAIRHRISTEDRWRAKALYEALINKDEIATRVRCLIEKPDLEDRSLVSFAKLPNIGMVDVEINADFLEVAISFGCFSQSEPMHVPFGQYVFYLFDKEHEFLVSKQPEGKLRDSYHRWECDKFRLLIAYFWRQSKRSSFSKNLVVHRLKTLLYMKLGKGPKHHEWTPLQDVPRATPAPAPADAPQDTADAPQDTADAARDPADHEVLPPHAEVFSELFDLPDFPGELEPAETVEILDDIDDTDDGVVKISSDEEGFAAVQVTVPQEDAPLLALAPHTPCMPTPSLAQAPMSQAVAPQTPCKPALSLAQAPMPQALTPQTANVPAPDCSAPESPVPPLPASFFAPLPKSLPIGLPGGSKKRVLPPPDNLLGLIAELEKHPQVVVKEHMKNVQKANAKPNKNVEKASGSEGDGGGSRGDGGEASGSQEANVEKANGSQGDGGDQECSDGD